MGLEILCTEVIQKEAIQKHQGLEILLPIKLEISQTKKPRS